MLVGCGLVGRMSVVGIDARGGVLIVGMLPVVDAGAVLMGLTVPRKAGLSEVGIDPLVALGVRGIGIDGCP
jgi:hypothetical protein